MRTKEEIKRQVEGLTEMRNSVPEFNAFGDNNWIPIDIQISILLNESSYSDYEDDEIDNERAAYDADDWLYSEGGDDLFEI